MRNARCPYSAEILHEPNQHFLFNPSCENHLRFFCKFYSYFPDILRISEFLSLIKPKNLDLDPLPFNPKFEFFPSLELRLVKSKFSPKFQFLTLFFNSLLDLRSFFLIFYQ